MVAETVQLPSALKVSTRVAELIAHPVEPCDVTVYETAPSLLVVAAATVEPVSVRISAVVGDQLSVGIKRVIVAEVALDQF